MKFVFWLLIIIVLVLVWFCLSFAFEGIGGIGLKMFRRAKGDITGEEEENQEKEAKEDHKK